MFSLPALLFVAVLIVAVYFLATRFDLDRDLIWENVRTMNPWLYVLALALYYLSFGFRGLRWRILARNAGIDDSRRTRLPSVARFAQLIVIGWFVNSVTFARLGDAYRAYALSEESGDDFSWSLGTVLAERVIDMATVVVLILIAAVSFSATSDSGGSGFIVAAALVMAAALATALGLMKRYGARVARFLPLRFEGAYHRFHKGALGGLRQLPVVFLLGLIGWLLEAARLYFVVHALDLTISLPLVLVVALGHAVLSTVPTPGGVGAVEPGVTGLLVLGLERNDAVSVALVDRSITYLSVILFGFLAFLLWQVTHSRRRPQGSPSADAPSAGAGMPESSTGARAKAGSDN